MQGETDDRVPLLTFKGRKNGIDRMNVTSRINQMEVGK